MFFSRFISLAVLASSALFTVAKPVDTSVLAARAPEALEVRGGSDYDALTAIIVDLKAKVDVQVALLDGKWDPSGPVVAISAALDASVKLIAAVNITGILWTEAQITAVVTIIVQIILSIVVALGKYSLLVILTLIVKIDVSLSAWITIILKLWPFLTVDVQAGINVNLLLALKLLLSIAALGL